MSTTTRLTFPLHMMPVDRARAEAARAAGRRVQAAGAALWRGLIALDAARSRGAMRAVAAQVAVNRPELAAALLSSQQKTVQA